MNYESAPSQTIQRRILMLRRVSLFALLLSLSCVLGGCSPVLVADKPRTGSGVIYALPTSVVLVKMKLGSVPILNAANKKRKQELENLIATTKAELSKAKEPSITKLKEKLQKYKSELKELIDSVPKIRALQIVPGAESVMADLDAQFLLSYSHAYSSDDTVEIRTTENGLLQSISSTAGDKTAEAISLTVKAGADAAVLSVTGGLSRLTLDALDDIKSEKVEPSVVQCSEQQDYEVEVPVDPGDREAAYQILETAIKAKTGQVCFHLDVYDSNVKLIYTSDKDKREQVNAEAVTSLKEGTSIDEGWCSKGACYRRKGSVIFHVRHLDRRVVSSTAQLSAPQLGAIGRIDFWRRAFVEAKGEADFSNGSLIRIKYTKPSELLAIARVPVDILETLFGIPSKLFETEAGRLQGRAKVIEAETSLIEARIKLLEKQRLETETLQVE